MQASELYKQLKPFSLLVNKRALSTSYKVLHLTPTHVRGHAPFGVMEVEAALGIDGEAFVDADKFLSVLSSMPAGQLEITLSENRLNWYCEDPNPDPDKKRYVLKGHFACVTDNVNVPAVPWEDKPRAQIAVNENFGKGLELAALGCGSQAYLSVGLYGIVLENQEEGLIAYASDNGSLATCRLADHAQGLADRITLAPDALALLAEVTSTGESSVSFTADAVYCEKPNCRLVIKRIAPLKVDLRALAEGLREQDRALPIARDPLTSFIRRVEALAQEGSKAVVSIAVEEGATRLDYDDGTSFSAEYYLVQSDEPFDIAPIQLEPRRIFRALGAADTIVFDYVDRKALVLRGPNDFLFAVHGKT